MRLATVAQSREIEEITQRVYGVSGEILMEAAGYGSAREIDQAYFPEISRGSIGVVCGPGNNGGDGLVVARHLHSMGHRDLHVFLLRADNKVSDLFELQVKRAELHGLQIVDLDEFPEKRDQIRSCTLVVDALFGIGLSRNIEGLFARCIDTMNASKVPIVSLDTPSGLDCDRGSVLGTCVNSAMTITFGLAKPGFFLSDGPAHVGRLKVVPIGFPFEALRGVATTHFGFNEKLARRYLPTRKDTSNKSDHGRLLIFAGQSGTWGAAVLCASAAYRMGVGYVTLVSFREPTEAIKEIPEVMTASYEDDSIWSQKNKVVAIGPGLGVGEKTAELIERLKQDVGAQVVVDADALTTCVHHDLFPLPKNWVITPHTGELARILKVDAQTIDSDRYSYGLKAAKHCGCFVLLKGFRSVLAHDDRAMVIMSGNSALAKAGTGDVLTGMIGGLLAQGMQVLQATATAAYIHGRIADEWVRAGNDKRSLNASDLRQHLPNLISRLAGGALF